MQKFTILLDEKTLLQILYFAQKKKLENEFLPLLRSTFEPRPLSLKIKKRNNTHCFFLRLFAIKENAIYPGDTPKHCVMLVMELCSGGELWDMISLQRFEEKVIILRNS